MMIIGSILFVVSLAVIASTAIIHRAARGRMFSDVAETRHDAVGLVLGCDQRLSSGRPSQFFQNRIEAASTLYRAGKVNYLIVSGACRGNAHDEPTDMRNALVERGVPADRIFRDGKAFRTLDSVARARQIFGVDQVTLVSQPFHNKRAIYLALHRGVDAIGFNAANVYSFDGFLIHCREQLAKVKAVLDIHLLHTPANLEREQIAIGQNIQQANTSSRGCQE